jgi:hypothetical protein
MDIAFLIIGIVALWFMRSIAVNQVRIGEILKQINRKIKVVAETTESGVSEIPTYQADRKNGNTDFLCDWCKRVLEVAKDNYYLCAIMYDEGVEENCTCNE